MYSFTSSSKYRVVALLVVVLLGIFLPYNHVITKYRWSGGMLIIVDLDSLKGLGKENYNADMLITGSSRAKECVRPTLIQDSMKLQKLPYNGANHSGSSADQVDKLASRSRFSPKYLLVTVEPLHFCTNRVMYIRDRTQGKNNTNTSENHNRHSIRTWFSASRDFNDNLQKNISSHVSNIIHNNLLATNPVLRRKLPVWFRIIGDIYYNLKNRAFTLASTAYDPFYFRIVSREALWYTTVVAGDNGYEGHELYLAGTRIKRREAFEAHKKTYVNRILPYISDQFFDKFADDLTTLKDRDTEILMVRLPVYHSLYQEEEKAWPGFNSSFEAISQKTGIPYVNLNTPEFSWMTEYAEFFCDGSHMEHKKTEPFNRALIGILKKHFTPEMTAGDSGN